MTGTVVEPGVLYPSRPILIVDDDPQMLKLVQLMLRTEGLTNSITCNDPLQVRDLLEHQAVSLILLDIAMPHMNGDELLTSLREWVPEVAVLMLTGQNDLDMAVRCMRLGAQDYLLKPFEPRRLMASARRALELGELQAEYRQFVTNSVLDEIQNPAAFSGIVGDCASLRAIFRYIEIIAHSRKPVLITGESGVGKELIAKAIHRLSCPDSPFVSETISGYDDTMLMDTLYGHVSGAYTSAGDGRMGLVAGAADGTLFLDEIGDLSPTSQLKLLRLIQEREYRHLGSDTVHRTAARFVFATNRDIVAMQKSGAFRRDLYYRISNHHIHVPPLRDRKSDIAPLVRHFVAIAAGELNVKPPAVPNSLYQLLRTYSFPGNVRELEHMVFNAVASTSGNTLSLQPFIQHIERIGDAAISDEAATNTPAGLFSDHLTLPTLGEVQEQLIDEAMRRSGGNQGIAARLLGISRTALNKRLNSDRQA
ncbi:MAG: sigma-54-dependent Fis family transcriptional regulator [Candidatus Hydrogenedentota bacterium]